MTKKTLLKVDYKPDYLAYGVFSPQKGYRLCWLINQLLDLRLTRLNDLNHAPSGRQEPLVFPVFMHSDSDPFSHLLLVGNKSGEGLLFNEPRNMDFLLLIKGDGGRLNVPETIRAIRGIPQVQAIYEVDKIIAPQAGGFFFDLELFLDKEQA